MQLSIASTFFQNVRLIIHIEILVTCRFVQRHFNRGNFNRSHFQPLAFLTASKLNCCKFDPFDYIQGYSIVSRRSKTIKEIKESIERHQSDSLK